MQCSALISTPIGVLFVFDSQIAMRVRGTLCFTIPPSTPLTPPFAQRRLLFLPYKFSIAPCLAKICLFAQADSRGRLSLQLLGENSSQSEPSRLLLLAKVRGICYFSRKSRATCIYTSTRHSAISYKIQFSID